MEFGINTEASLGVYMVPGCLSNSTTLLLLGGGGGGGGVRVLESLWIVIKTVVHFWN